MVRLTSTISRLITRKILVIGDLMLDTYTIGKAKRISPEAPVAVIEVQREENRPGGAGNVALNLRSLGAEVYLMGRLGNDSTGEVLQEALISEDINTSALFFQQGFATPMKNRIIADNQQLVRVDYEQVVPLPEMLEQEIIDLLPTLMKDMEAIAVSDYGKGFLSKTLLAAVYECAKSNHIPVITDPKGIDFTKYQGTTVIKPNLSEAYAAAGLQAEASLDLAAQKLMQLASAETLMITRSEAGLSVFHKNGERQDFPVRVREIKDVTGAGDTVLAMLTFAMANDLEIAEIAQLSNIAAGIAIEHFGCARVGLSDIARRLLETDVENKIFDKEHLFALQQVLSQREYLILGISAAAGMTSSIFSTIQRLAKNKERDLVIFMQDNQSESDQAEDEFLNLLASMQDVKFIIVHSDDITRLCAKVPPAEIYGMNGKELLRLDSAFDFKKV